MNKVPDEIRLIITKGVKREEWELDGILEKLQGKLEARKQSYQLQMTQSNGNLRKMPKEISILQHWYWFLKGEKTFARSAMDHTILQNVTLYRSLKREKLYCENKDVVSFA